MRLSRYIRPYKTYFPAGAKMLNYCQTISFYQAFKKQEAFATAKASWLWVIPARTDTREPVPASARPGRSYRSCCGRRCSW